MRTLTLLLAISLGLGGAARADPADTVGALEADQARLNRTEHRLMVSLTADGAMSTAAGIALLVPGNDDQAWRVAGGVTLAFGAIDLVLGITGTLGTARELRDFVAARPQQQKNLLLARRDLVAAARKKEAIFALNLGLDVAYVTGGSVAILASQLGVDHGGRWLAGGSAAVAQGLALGIIDLVGMLAAKRLAF